MSRRRKIIDVIRTWSQWLIVAVAATCSLCGLLWQSVSLLGGGAAVLCLVLRQLGGGTQSPEARRSERRSESVAHEGPGFVEQPPVLEQLQQNTSPAEHRCARRRATRHAVVTRSLLRPETKQHLTQLQVVRAIRQLDESMALVPAGRVLLGQLAEQSHSACGPTDIDPKLRGAQPRQR